MGAPAIELMSELMSSDTFFRSLQDTSSMMDEEIPAAIINRRTVYGSCKLLDEHTVVMKFIFSACKSITIGSF